jgi:hypothetical protein
MYKPKMSICAALAVMAVAVGVAGAGEATEYKDPVPHQLITQPYQVCQNLDELTSRIDNLYRKPFDKTVDPKTGVMQPETVYFKDSQTGVEIASITRELCQDISHPDLGRPCWTCDGSHILFMGSRAYLGNDGKIQQNAWPGHKYIMSADYIDQRAMGVRFDPPWENAPKFMGGGTISRVDAGIYSKFNIMDPVNPKLAYYAVADKLWQVTLSDHGDSTAKLICTFSNAEPKIIQDISPTRKLLIQDANTRADATGKLPYMPEFHLIDLNKKSGEPGFYYHHSMDYGLPEVKDQKGHVVHAADNNHWVHSMGISPDGNTISWNYGPMTDVGEPLGWYLDDRNGLDGTPTHDEVKNGASENHWGQYESHGSRIGGANYVLYFSGPPVDSNGKPLPGKWGWGIYIRDTSTPDSPPRYIMNGPGGHIAGGNSQNPDVWAAYMSAGWKIPAADDMVWGRTDGMGAILCRTYSLLRGCLREKNRAFTSWTGPDSGDGRPYAAIPRPLLSPDGTKVWFHSSMLMPAENWVGAFVAVIQRPQPPRDLSASGSGDVQLSWKPAAMSRETKGYHVYRGDADGKNFVELTSSAIPATSFTDSTAKPGNTYAYAVTAEEWSTLESDAAASLKVSVTAAGVTGSDAGPIKGWDTTAPPPVEDFTVKAEAPGQYRLAWSKDSATDVRYYNVYFSSKERPAIAQERLVVSPPSGATQYLDWSAPIGPGAHYAITAVDRQGNESAPVYADLEQP